VKNAKPLRASIMIRKLIDFAPAELALAPRPLEGELTSSWLYRVAAANLVELEELLSGLMNIYPEVHSRTNICLDYSIAPAWSRALARWCRLAESRGPHTGPDASVPG